MTRSFLWLLALVLWTLAVVGVLKLEPNETRAPARGLARDVSPSPCTAHSLPRPFAVTPEDFHAEASP